MSRADYMKEYYQKNKERIQKSRRVRYENDESYRKKLHRSRVQTRNRFKALEELKKKQLSIENGEDFVVESGKKKRVRTPDGRTAIVHMYTLGQVCDILDIKRDTFENWTNKAYVPEATYRDHNNWRLYTEDQVRALKNILDREVAFCVRNRKQLRMNKSLKEKTSVCFDNLEFGLEPSRFEQGQEDK